MIITTLVNRASAHSIKYYALAYKGPAQAQNLYYTYIYNNNNIFAIIQNSEHRERLKSRKKKKQKQKKNHSVTRRN